MVNGPVVASHSNARALAPNKRNLSDEQIQAPITLMAASTVTIMSPRPGLRISASMARVVVKMRQAGRSRSKRSLMVISGASSRMSARSRQDGLLATVSNGEAFHLW